MNSKFKIILFLGIFSVTYGKLSFKNGQNEVHLLPLENGIKFILLSGTEEKLSGIIGLGRNFTKYKFYNYDNKISAVNSKDGSPEFTLQRYDKGFKIAWSTTNLAEEYQDCFDLKVGELNWYGGPEKYNQQWPIEKLVLNGNQAYVIHKSDNNAISEPYWLNSAGTYIFVSPDTPLFVDQNNQNVSGIDNAVCFIAKLEGPYIQRNKVALTYTLNPNENAKIGHLHAVNNILGKPTGHPNELMVREPIWTTWARYKQSIDDSVVINFAQEIVDHGCKGQLEIDDNWEECYGAQTFTQRTFSDISNTVSTLKEMGFRVTAWVHPFVNDDCQSNSVYGQQNDLFVKSDTGDNHASWWNSDNAYQIDFTNEQARDWFTGRLRALQESPGIDSFKFDAGEIDYVAQPAVYPLLDPNEWPNGFTQNYVRTCAEFGDLIEVRSGWRTQDLPVFVRMLDKDSRWGTDNGLHSLVTTLLQMNMNGYTMVLPDMIGGNGYGQAPTSELIIRWTQANTFMPTMQFSYCAWDFPSENYDTWAITKKYVDLHEQYADAIIAAMDASITDGTPVNPPIWWVDPTDPQALQCDDEFMLGENILVAPVIVEGATTRNIYLPMGQWKDGQNGDIYDGPQTLENYPAPIDVLPYFIKQ